MKNLFIVLVVFVALIIGACSESTSPAKDPDIKIVGELAEKVVKSIAISESGDKIQANEVDSIKIIRIRILMSRMKLFLTNEDANAGKELKTGPFIYDLDGTGNLIKLSENSVLPGIYEKIKFEFHRFSPSDLSQYENDAVFRDFATPDRYSILIEGITYKNDNPSIFMFKSQTTANLMLKFEPSLNLTANSNTTVSIQLNPNDFFKKWTSILDPNDPNNANDIENAIINTIKALKK